MAKRMKYNINGNAMMLAQRESSLKSLEKAKQQEKQKTGKWILDPKTKIRKFVSNENTV
ncbi:MAG: hypothetical protein KBA33_08265 [Cloacibacterium sp.]|nr:hypothetical protein [Cloacibacterium sp.]